MTETSLAYLNRAGNVGRGNCISAVRAELYGRDVVPTRCSMGSGGGWVFKWNVFRGGHPQRLGLKGWGAVRGRESRGRVTHGGGDVRSLNRVEEGREIGTFQMGPEGNHVAGVFDQE